MTRTLFPLFAMLVATACGERPVVIDVSADEGAAVKSWLLPAAGERIDRFEVGGSVRSPLVDILFVVDPSVSMGKVRDTVRSGFASLADDPDVWPDKVRIGVMMAVPTLGRSGPDGATRRVHRAVRGDAWDAHVPGTHGLVDAEGIATYSQALKARCDLHPASQWSTTRREACAAKGVPVDRLSPHTGCEAWFRPGDVDASGTSCLVAHTWIPESVVGAEAGLVALDELARDPAADWFRPGAVANVVFVSDTHDPGLPPKLLARSAARQRLLARTADLEGILQRVAARGVVSGLRLHAIAPATPCVEPWSPLGATYADAAELTGGYTVDLCTADDYTPLIRRIAEDGAVPTRGVFPLGSAASELVDVTVDGDPVQPDRILNQRILELDLDLSEPHDVDVQYKLADPDAVRRMHGLGGPTAQ